jgi:hypothetical protein
MNFEERKKNSTRAGQRKYDFVCLSVEVHGQTISFASDIVLVYETGSCARFSFNLGSSPLVVSTDYIYKCRTGPLPFFSLAQTHLNHDKKSIESL